MPRISIDNYDTIASWNGSEDLFVVEQPDGTKVATPAMVKQFMQAGDFEATGEVKDGHGNMLADKCSVAAYNWNLGNVTADSVYTLNNFKNTVGLSGKNIVAVGLVFVAGSSDYDYGAAVIFRSDFARLKITKTQTNTTARLYIIYTI